MDTGLCCIGMDTVTVRSHPQPSQKLEQLLKIPNVCSTVRDNAIGELCDITRL